MQTRKSKCNNVTIMCATNFARGTIDRTIRHAQEFTDDPEKENRHKQQECPVCYYYIGRIGGAAWTDAECALCSKLMHFESTCIDILCVDCAKKHGLCHHCGGDIDAKQRKRQRF